MIYHSDLKQAQDAFKQNKMFLQRLKKARPKDLDDQFQHLHENAFDEIDCLQCANCCKTTSPIFLPSDIERLAKTLKMKVSEFIANYLKTDEEGDHVLLEAPCPFLGQDNKCIVYESRPKACKEYPHTNRKRMYQITTLTLKNTLVCPAVNRIVAQLKEIYR